MPTAAATVKTKKSCCKDGPRCATCPVVWKLLEKAGYAERVDRRTWAPTEKIPKQVMKAARAR